jgi:hypothetical protein
MCTLWLYSVYALAKEYNFDKSWYAPKFFLGITKWINFDTLRQNLPRDVLILIPNHNSEHAKQNVHFLY